MTRRINLVPQSERTRTTTDIGMLALIAVVVLVIFGIGLGYYLLNGRLDSKQQELADVQQEVSQLQIQVAALDQFAQLSAQREKTEANVQQIYAGRTLVASALDALSFVVPEDAWFENLTLQTSDPVAKAGAGGASQGAAGQGDNTVSIEGNTYSFEQVSQVLTRLQLIPQLKNVALVAADGPNGSTDPTKDVKGFSLSASLVNTQPADTPLPLIHAEVATP